MPADIEISLMVFYLNKIMLNLEQVGDKTKPNIALQQQYCIILLHASMKQQ